MSWLSQVNHILLLANAHENASLSFGGTEINIKSLNEGFVTNLLGKNSTLLDI